MKQHFLRVLRPIAWAAATLVVPALVAFAWAATVPRTSVNAANERIITIHYDGIEQTVATNAETVQEVLRRANIALGEFDNTEPAKTEKLVAPTYHINVYRARPITVVEGSQRYRILSPHQSAKKIVEAAGLPAYDEDTFELTRIEDFLSEGGMGLKLTIDRSVPVKAILYDKPVDMRTQATTVQEFLIEKGIELKPGDQLFPAAETPITPNIALAVYRDGSQAVKEEDLPFATEKIQDKDREVGYRQVKEAGMPGKRFVIYQLEVKDGREVRTEIQSITIAEPKKQVEIIGAKTKTASFDGDFAAALARLRSCEGKYTSVNPIGYYGAYQFNINTWRGAAPAGYADVRPDQAPPEVQDQAARNLYVRRGWQPWPACSKKLGLQDIYR